MANLLKMAMLATILAFHRLGWSNRRIARELGIDRDTVSRHLRTVEAQSKTAKAPTGSEPSPNDAKAAKAPPGSDDVAAESKAAQAPPGSGTIAEPALAREGRSLCAAWHDPSTGRHAVHRSG